MINSVTILRELLQRIVSSNLRSGIDGVKFTYQVKI